MSDNIDSPPANEADDFNKAPWHALVGIMSGDTIATAGDMRIQVMLDARGMVPDGKGNSVPDKTIAAVHFADWLERNKQSIVNLWQVEYTQYMNMKRMTAPKPGANLSLVDKTGQRLGTDIVQ
jgi:hypothetical protein